MPRQQSLQKRQRKREQKQIEEQKPFATQQSPSPAPSLQRTRLIFKLYWQHLASRVREPMWSSRNDLHNISKPIQPTRHFLGMPVSSAVIVPSLRPRLPHLLFFLL